MDEITVPIYLMTGFLESGKTSFLSFTIRQDFFPEFYHTAGLFPYGWKDTSDPL